jgi:hypothetical protein
MVFFCGKAYDYAVFITHNWGEDELGRPNHDRAIRINEALKKNASRHGTTGTVCKATSGRRCCRA